ncbi:uncharacterized protein GGS25DRAFT_493591 [Hypoxylon fragiforme]|uniref:uncharacterized protein n=1 Tax=Hypoxylon fragiforme TaxID=63214 RepID=UPI0020C68E4B|nr:uncharacterized protein GGS25DRAFT_493591 [Hypoxylon fragiforme]KAI2606874.1 hypothetical protein GGS25DRAFT_493591 [Hypoxylon fragiforme]
MCSADLFLGLLAILFPPLAVWVKTGLCSADSIINLLLCVLGYIPGLLHAWYIIAKFPETYEYDPVSTDADERGARGGSVRYVFVEPQPHPQPQVHPHHYPQQPNYGTAAAAGSSSAGPATEGEEGRAPPTYAEAVKGDHKIQTHD